METFLVLIYAFLAMNTSQGTTRYTGEGMDEMERQIQAGDDIRREVQEARNNI